MKFLDELNDEQRRAAGSAAPYVSIIAGPGTGKTKTLTARVAHLLTAQAMSPEQLVALTFTKKAAQEIQSRVIGLVGPKLGKRARITTFHGLCYELLQTHQAAPLTIITEPERLALIAELRKAASLKDMTTRELFASISRLKSLPDQAASDTDLQKLFTAYNTALKERNLVDFDDLLLLTHRFLQDDTLQFQHVLVDEFQDTSAVQYDILLRLKPHHLFVIGDPLQSIYGFRGASGEVFEQFGRDFAGAEHITLTTNYRSVPNAVHTGNAIFPAAPQLTANRDEAGAVQAVEVLNEYTEAEWIISVIEQAIGGTDFLRSHQTTAGNDRLCAFKDFAVLYRTHRAAATLQRALAESGIPYQVVGDGSPYDQPIIKSVIAMLRYIHDPTVARLRQLRDIPLLRTFTVNQLQQLLAPLLPKVDVSPAQLAHMLLETFHLASDKPAVQRDLNQYMGSLVRFDDAGLEAYIQHLDDSAEQSFYDPQANCVTLLTIHAAKGLEFPHVFVLAAEEDILPHKRPNKPTDVEEEKRLFYVAVTRARDRLDILHARTRAGKPANVSRFVSSLPVSILPRIVDPSLGDQQKRAHKRRQKRSQASLF